MNNEIQLKNINKKFKSKIALNKVNLSFDQKKILQEKGLKVL